MRYAIWNNKGGVGKTFLTFQIGTEYAIANPTKRVVIVDLCPEANVSEIVLGGNGSGSRNLNSLLSATPRRTIGGYFDERISNPHRITGTEVSYLVPNLRQYNRELPVNLHAVIGDPSLELQAQAMNQISAQTLPADSWRNVHLWAKDLMDAIAAQLGDQTTFFIDCNPSFATYTELALLAANRLIVPCTADGSSARAIDNMGALVYGMNVPAIYAPVNFSTRARASGLALPAIHIVALNRSTQWEQRASRAFRAMFEEIKARSNRLAQAGVAFSSSANHRFFDVPDAHTVSVVCSYEGVPISRLRMGPHSVGVEDVQVNREPYERYLNSIRGLIALL